MLTTYGISILGGILCGFLVSKVMPHPEVLFDDLGHCAHCEYGDDNAQWNKIKNTENA